MRGPFQQISSLLLPCKLLVFCNLRMVSCATINKESLSLLECFLAVIELRMEYTIGSLGQIAVDDWTCHMAALICWRSVLDGSTHYHRVHTSEFSELIFF